jgi:hypothetical protein
MPTPDLATVLAEGNDAADQAIKNLPPPSDPDDAATKDYVDSSHPEPHLFVQTAEPDAAPGDLWIDPTPGPQPFATRKRNESGDGWLIGDTLDVGGTYSGWQIHDDGSVVLAVGASEIRIDPDGSIRMPTLPGVDPAIPGALWREDGTVKVSAG